jgi:hypothetical protein
MIETVAFVGVFGLTLSAIAGLYYKMGKLETKISFIYDNLKTVVSFKNNNHKH